MSEALEGLDKALQEYVRAHRAVEMANVRIEALEEAKERVVTERRLALKREEEAEAEVNGIINAIIDVETFEAAQAKLKTAVGETAVAVVKEAVIRVTYPEDL